jgi:hypothetical protein
MLLCLFIVLSRDHLLNRFWGSNDQNAKLTTHLDSLLSLTSIPFYGMVLKHKENLFFYIT